jgi:hypothetical protein
VKMKLRDVQTSLGTWMGRLKQALDPPLTADAPPLEVREAILDAVEQRIVPAGGGQRVLAHNQIAVTVLVPSPDDRLALGAVLGNLSEAVVNRLREVRCQVPPGFAVTVHYVRRPRPGWPPDRRFAIDYSVRDVPKPSATAPSGPPSLHVVVVRGSAARPSYTLNEPHVQIGRTEQPVDAGGRPRKNHVAFLEDGDADSGSVGRAHASIRFEPARGEYRIFDEGSRNGTRLVRNGKTLEIVRRDPTGVTILSGDEIHFGTATVRVEIAPSSPGGDVETSEKKS